MNIFTIMSLNKHGDYQEVLFTSSLSYLFNPKNDHNLGVEFLKEFIKDVKIEDFDVQSIPSKVKSEYSLDNNHGKIDILLEYKDHDIGIEAKIWDRSAKGHPSMIPQLERYCTHFGNRKKKWKIIYLIPNEYSKICIAEYENLKFDYKKNVSLMVWNNSINSTLPNSFLSRSVSDIIKDFFKTKGLTSIKPQPLWILDSLLEFIPKLDVQIKEEKRFPAMRDLQKLKTWSLFNSFILHFKIRVDPQHTVSSVPYGKESEKAKLHQNCLFRIRITKNYYSKISDKENFLPLDYLEIELWEDVYNKIEDLLKAWMKDNFIPDDFLYHGYHLDATKKVSVKILKIESVLSEVELARFDGIIRLGFFKLLNP